MKVKREHIEWCNIWVTAAPDEQTSRVALIGDSITQSYYGRVEQILAASFTCARLTTSKCVCDPSFSKELKLLLDEYPCSIIHLNNGLHGWDYTERAYAQSLKRTFSFIRSRWPESILIWAQTTPVRKNGAPQELDEQKTARVRERNLLARQIAFEQGIPVNDLYSVVEDHPEYYAPDGVHFAEPGVAALASQVAQCILELKAHGL